MQDQSSRLIQLIKTKATCILSAIEQEDKDKFINEVVRGRAFVVAPKGSLGHGGYYIYTIRVYGEHITKHKLVFCSSG